MCFSRDYKHWLSGFLSSFTRFLCIDGGFSLSTSFKDDVFLVCSRVHRTQTGSIAISSWRRFVKRPGWEVHFKPVKNFQSAPNDGGDPSVSLKSAVDICIYVSLLMVKFIKNNWCFIWKILITTIFGAVRDEISFCHSTVNLFWAY